VLKSSQEITVEFGPFICLDETTLQKSYYLCYKEGEEWVRFGYKFGFAVKGFKPVEAIKVIEDPRDKIRKFKRLSGSSKS
jgi:hypothetical protein